MNINIPDKLYKLALLIGIILAGYSFLNFKETRKEYDSHFREYESLKDSLSIKEMHKEKSIEELLDYSEIISKKYNVENPITQNDSILRFTQILTGDKNKLKVSDSIRVFWNRYLDISFDCDIYNKKVGFKSESLGEVNKDYNYHMDEMDGTMMLSIILIFLGVISWGIDSDSVKNNKTYNRCQSCGKLFSAMVKKGTEQNDTENHHFCLTCYTNGKFTEPEKTKEEFFAEIEEKIKDKNFIIKIITRGIYRNLERWNISKIF